MINWEEIAFELRLKAGDILLGLEVHPCPKEISELKERLQEACNIYDELYKESLSE